jgi:Ca2+-transporting ATPase
LKFWGVEKKGVDLKKASGRQRPMGEEANVEAKKQKNPEAESYKTISRPWEKSIEAVCRRLEISPEEGLSASQVRERRNRYGSNRLREAKVKSAWTILFNQFKNVIILLLAAAGALSFVFGEWMEGLSIAAVIIINAAIGFFTELRAVRSMEALQRLGRVKTKVRRGKQVREIPAEQVVPGDIVILDGGDFVSADLRLIEASQLQVDESTLTGESLPVDKAAQTVAGDAPLAERANMVFKGTGVTRGSAEGVTVGTGMDTELGRISSLIREAQEEETPLEKRLDRLGRRLIWLTLIIAAAVAVIGIFRTRKILAMIETAIALAVAAIPEGLPIVATIALGRGMWRMARRNALINRLSAVETLGATNVIFTDKTGTLTENRMTVTRIVTHVDTVEIVAPEEGSGSEFRKNGQVFDPGREAVVRRALEVGMRCNNASLGASDSAQVGDPMEVALLRAGTRAGIERNRLEKEMPRSKEVAFDPEVKMMAVYYERDGGYEVNVKGAPEAVVGAAASFLSDRNQSALNDEFRREWLARSDRLAEEGMRVLALAYKSVDSLDENPYQGLTLIGLVGLVDPPRKDVRRVIEQTHKAGIRVIMVTGDQSLTARKIALETGLVDDKHAEVIEGRTLKNLTGSSEQGRRLEQVSIFSRVSPNQKLDLIELFKKDGYIVAMTGDGVNDAPALKRADIGIAMGRRGTQVAREAADMVLKDDAFSTIVSAIGQGRVIFTNIRKFVLYLISCNVSEIAAVGLASLAGATLPILPLQILFLNLVTDVFPALALDVGEGDPGVMKRPPRDPREPFLTQRHWYAIAGYGAAITFAVLASLALAISWLGMQERRAVTVSFLTLAFGQLWHVFNMRDRRSSITVNDVTRNPFVWGALGLCTALLLAAIYIPGLSFVLRLEPPGAAGWLLVIGLSLIPLVLGQAWKSYRARSDNGDW